jgi:signal transduction histidine kinase
MAQQRSYLAKRKQVISGELSLERQLTDPSREEQQQELDTLQVIVEGTAAAIGADFFHSLVRHLAAALEVSFAYVAECLDAERSRARILAFWKAGQYAPSREYNLIGTPCEIVSQGETFYQSAGIYKDFPRDVPVRLGIEGYLGTPLFDSFGNVIGHLVAMDNKPLPEKPRGLSIMQIFAARAGAELERMRVEAALRFVAEGTANQTGDGFFASLVQHLSAALQVRQAFVTECAGEAHSRLRVLAYWQDERPGETFEYELAGSICERVLASPDAYYEGDVAAFSGNDNRAPFPIDAQSYLGIALRDAAGNALGHLAVLHDKPLNHDTRSRSILKIFAARAGAELERLRADTALRQALRQEQAMRDQLVQAGKLAAMGRLVASVAHELNNPLQVIENVLYLIDQEKHSPQSETNLALALAEAERMAALISRLRETYRPATAEEFRPQSLNDLLLEVQRLMGTHLRYHHVHIIFDADPTLPPVRAIRDQLKQVILNLALNAVEAMPDGGRLIIGTGVRPAANELWFSVTDSGVGIPADDLPNVFDPFYTTKPNGTGLGLAITYDIIQRHSGRIEVESQPGQGTTFTVWLPVSEAVTIPS